jgi:hypothetical protein
MSRDKRAEIVEAMAREMFLLDRARAGSDAEAEYIKWENFRLTEGGKFWISRASAALDIALKAAAAEVQRLANEWHKEWRAGHKANTHLEGKSDGADECAAAILALTSEGVKE